MTPTPVCILHPRLQKLKTRKGPQTGQPPPGSHRRARSPAPPRPPLPPWVSPILTNREGTLQLENWAPAAAKPNRGPQHPTPAPPTLCGGALPPFPQDALRELPLLLYSPLQAHLLREAFPDATRPFPSWLPSVAAHRAPSTRTARSRLPLWPREGRASLSRGCTCHLNS